MRSSTMILAIPCPVPVRHRRPMTPPKNPYHTTTPRLLMKSNPGAA